MLITFMTVKLNSVEAGENIDNSEMIEKKFPQNDAFNCNINFILLSVLLHLLTHIPQLHRTNVRQANM